MAAPQGPFYEQLGERIARAREKRPGLTQAKLAKQVGLSRTSIVNIEAGRQPVYLHHLVVIADMLQVAPAALIPQASAEPVGLKAELSKIDDVVARSFAEKVLGPHNDDNSPRDISNET